MIMRTTTCSAAILSLFLSATAMADRPGDKDKDDKDRKGRSHHQTVVVFGENDKSATRAYWNQMYGRGKCPPGLAKKGNGCLPPGIAAKRYVIGQPIPASLAYYPAPARLVSRLTPAPAGYQYVIVDGDLVKMAVDTRMVADAIFLMLN